MEKIKFQFLEKKIKEDFSVPYLSGDIMVSYNFTKKPDLIHWKLRIGAYWITITYKVLDPPPASLLVSFRVVLDFIDQTWDKMQAEIKRVLEQEIKDKYLKAAFKVKCPTKEAFTEYVKEHYIEEITECISNYLKDYMEGIREYSETFDKALKEIDVW